MPKRPSAKLVSRTLDALTIGDERAFRNVAMFADLVACVRRGKLRFRVLPEGRNARHDRALLLNLTYWTPGGGDVLAGSRIPADVVAHAAWHHLAARAMPARAGRAPTAASLFLGEAIASAFDVYLVGRLLQRPGRSAFLESQVPAMAETAAAAGLSARGFEQLLASFARDPEGSFEALRALLFDATRALHASADVVSAHAALAAFDASPLSPLLHRYELSNWVLFARAYGRSGADREAARVDASLRASRAPLAWLEQHWVAPALA